MRECFLERANVHEVTRVSISSSSLSTSNASLINRTFSGAKRATAVHLTKCNMNDCEWWEDEERETRAKSYTRTVIQHSGYSYSPDLTARNELFRVTRSISGDNLVSRNNVSSEFIDFIAEVNALSCSLSRSKSKRPPNFMFAGNAWDDTTIKHGNRRLEKASKAHARSPRALIADHKARGHERERKFLFRRITQCQWERRKNWTSYTDTQAKVDNVRR